MPKVGAIAYPQGSVTVTLTYVKAQSADAALVAEIAKIKAVDNHAHPWRFVGEGEPADNEYDALALEKMEPFPNPVRIRPDKR